MNLVSESSYSRQHLRNSGPSGSGNDKHGIRYTYRRHARCLLLLSCITAVIFCVALFLPPKVPQLSMRLRSTFVTLEDGIMPTVRPSTLVIYVYSTTDPEYEQNLQFLTRHGMWEGDGCQYVVIVQQDENQPRPAKLPELPANAHYIFHTNRCYDLGTVGWAIEKGMVDTQLYRYIIFMNSSSRGPFFPKYHPKGLHWSRVLTDRLTKDVKLVGSTISCESAYERRSLSPVRHNPHVQSYIMATDQVGMRILQGDGGVLTCYENMNDTVFYAEVGASAAILDHGYTIDSLMLRYKDTSWRNQSNWNCNAGINPYAEFAYDGLLLNPLEVLFVKVKAFQIQTTWVSAIMATTYERWLSPDNKVNSNLYKDHRYVYRLGKAIALLIRGSACFDFDLYLSKNPDLTALGNMDAVWEHFVTDGQFEGRVFRFTCANPLQDNSVAEALLRVAKATLPQLMHKAFPEGLPQAAVGADERSHMA